jgi:hypothetical protein
MRLFPILALAACGTPHVDDATWADLGTTTSELPFAADAVAPPLPLDLVLTNSVLPAQGEVAMRGQTATFEVNGAPAGRTVVLVVSANLAGNPACPAAIAPECLGVGGPFLVIAQNLADASGFVRFDLPFPAVLPPSDLAFQAVSLRGNQIYLSDTLPVTVIDPFLDVTGARLRAVYNYDAALDVGTSWTTSLGDTQDPFVVLELWNDDWDGDFSQTQNYCQFLQTSAVPLARAPWTLSDPNVVFGLTFPVGGDFRSSCTFRLDPARFPDIEAELESSVWSFGLYGDLDPTLEADLLSNNVDPALVDTLVTGAWDGTWGVLTSNIYPAYLYEVGPNGPLYDPSGEPIRLPRADFYDGVAPTDVLTAWSAGINLAFLENL